MLEGPFVEGMLKRLGFYEAWVWIPLLDYFLAARFKLKSQILNTYVYLFPICLNLSFYVRSYQQNPIDFTSSAPQDHDRHYLPSMLAHLELAGNQGQKPPLASSHYNLRGVGGEAERFSSRVTFVESL